MCWWISEEPRFKIGMDIPRAVSKFFGGQNSRANDLAAGNQDMRIARRGSYGLPFLIHERDTPLGFL